MEEKYYIYRHIRPDKNQVFYIGVGTKRKNCKSTSGIYSRAHIKINRNSIWNSIVKRNNNNYEVEILFESNDYEFILEKEKEFISIYGRINIGTGTLSNLTEGGEGTLGRVVSKETKEKMSMAQKGRKYSEERIAIMRKMDKSFAFKPIIQYDLEGNFIKEWDSTEQASFQLKIERTSISACLRGLYKHSNYSIWRYKTDNYPIKIEICDKLKKLKKNREIKARWKNKEYIKYKRVRVVDIITNEVLEFDQILLCEKAMKFTNISRFFRTGRVLYKKRYKLELI